MKMSKAFFFIRGDIHDTEGRFLRDYWLFSDEELERTHDYIQWMFPLPTLSAYNPDAPLLTEQDIARCRRDPYARHNFHKSMQTMARFYWNNREWVRDKDHNHLRITRILKSARLIHPDEQWHIKFFSTIIGLTEGSDVPESTKQFWWNVIYPTKYTIEDAK